LNAQLTGQDLNLPPAPRAVERVLGLLHSPDCEFEDLARLIAEDQVVSATVLRIANSPIYRGNDRITALKPALTRLGLGPVRTLMLHESLRAAMFPGGAADRALAQMLWDRSLASGCVMRRLSSVVGTNEESSFLIGLLQDVGNVVVLREAHRQQALTHRHVQLEAFEHLCLKYHQVFGRALAEYWQLPPEIKDLIGDHHDYPAADDPLRTERWQIQLCEMIRSMLGYGPEVEYDLVNSAPARALGLDGREDFTRLLDDLPGHLDEALEWYAG
jgi:HD-like signal output (HDOD) protein